MEAARVYPSQSESRRTTEELVRLLRTLVLARWGDVCL